MQHLEVKVRNENGQETMKTVKVVRAWSTQSTSIYLHHDGTYGYKDGAPVRNLAELEAVITHPGHLNNARTWWKQRGQAMSAAYYQAIAEREQAKIGQFQESGADDQSALDEALYLRRDLSKGKKSALSGPLSWLDCGYGSRPDWWGQAENIVFGRVQYIKAEGEAEEAGPGTEADKATVASPPTVPPEAGLGNGSDEPQGETF